MPRLDLCEREHELRQIVGHMLPCNWLQVMGEPGRPAARSTSMAGSSSTPLGAAGRLTDDPSARYNATMHQQADRMQRGAYPIVQIVPNKYGFTKGMRDSDAPDVWQLGAPVFFPISSIPTAGTAAAFVMTTR